MSAPDLYVNMETARRDLRERLPELARVYGLKPWDVELLTGAELSAFFVDLERLHIAEQRQHDELERLKAG
jgi:RecA-family ATPase